MTRLHPNLSKTTQWNETGTILYKSWMPKPGMVADACNPSTLEPKGGVMLLLQAQGHSGLHTEFKSSPTVLTEYLLYKSQKWHLHRGVLKTALPNSALQTR